LFQFDSIRNQLASAAEADKKIVAELETVRNTLKEELESSKVD